MFELDEIPEWMVQYIPEITDDSHNIIEGITDDMLKLKPLHMEGGGYAKFTYKTFKYS